MENEITISGNSIINGSNGTTPPRAPRVLPANPPKPVAETVAPVKRAAKAKAKPAAKPVSAKPVGKAISAQSLAALKAHRTRLQMQLDSLSPAARRGKRGSELRDAIAAKDTAISNARVTKASVKTGKMIAAKAQVTRLRNMVKITSGKAKAAFKAQLEQAESRLAAFA